MQIIFCRYRKFISAHLLDQHYSELKQVSVFMPIPTILRNNTVSQAWHFSVIITQHCALFSLYWHLAWIYGVSTGRWLLELLLPGHSNSLTGSVDTNTHIDAFGTVPILSYFKPVSLSLWSSEFIPSLLVAHPASCASVLSILLWGTSIFSD